MEQLSKNKDRVPPPPPVQNNVQTQVREVLEEHKEKDEKINNLMIFNLPESDKEKDQDDQVKADSGSANDVLKFLDSELDESCIQVSRLGRRREDGDVRPRPVKVFIPDSHSRQRILKKVRQLKNYKLPKIGVFQDKTKKEIEDERKLRAELMEKRRSSDLEYTIFNKRVVLKSDIPKIREELSHQTKETTPEEVNKGTNGTNPAQGEAEASDSKQH